LFTVTSETATGTFFLHPETSPARSTNAKKNVAGR
jgi:hypothetical protein